MCSFWQRPISCFFTSVFYRQLKEPIASIKNDLPVPTTPLAHKYSKKHKVTSKLFVFVHPQNTQILYNLIYFEKIYVAR